MTFTFRKNFSLSPLLPWIFSCSAVCAKWHSQVQGMDQQTHRFGSGGSQWVRDRYSKLNCVLILMEEKTWKLNTTPFLKSNFHGWGKQLCLGNLEGISAPQVEGTRNCYASSLSVFCGQVSWFNPSWQLSTTNPLLTSPSTERNFEKGLGGGALKWCVHLSFWSHVSKQALQLLQEPESF